MIKNKSQEFNLTAGIASSASDKLTLSKKFKTLHNVEQNDDLGAITARHGTAKAAAFWPYRYQNLIALTKQNGDYIGLLKNGNYIFYSLVKISEGVSDIVDITPVNIASMPPNGAYITFQTAVFQEIYGMNAVSAVDTYISFPGALLTGHNKTGFNEPIKYKKGETQAVRHGAYKPDSITADITFSNTQTVIVTSTAAEAYANNKANEMYAKMLPSVGQESASQLMQVAYQSAYTWFMTNGGVAGTYYIKAKLAASYIYSDGSESEIIESAIIDKNTQLANFKFSFSISSTNTIINQQAYITSAKFYYKIIELKKVVPGQSDLFFIFQEEPKYTFLEEVKTVNANNFIYDKDMGEIEKYFYSPGNLEERDYYIPKPVTVLFFKGLIFGLGDSAYPRNIYFTTEFKSEFDLLNSIEISMPNSDQSIIGGAVIGNNLFVFSENGIYRVTYQGVTGVEFTVETVPTSVGCIAPMTITEAYGAVYFLSKQGIVKFDGFNISIESTDIQDIFKDILLTKYTKDIFRDDVQGLSGYVTEYYPPFMAKAAFNKKNDCIYFALPINVTESTNVYYQYFLKTKAWRTVDIPDFKDFVRGADDGSIKYVTTDGYIREFVDTCADYIGDTAILDTAENIDAIIETHSQYFGERTLFQAIRFFGTGTVNITVTIDRGRRVLTFPNKVLTELGPEIKLNTQGTEFSWKIDVLTSETFKLKGVELFYANEGAKQRLAPANGV